MTKKVRALITEETSESHAELMRELQNLGFDVTSVPRDGQRVLDYAMGPSHYDVVIMDLNLARIDSITAIHEINTSCPGTAVMAMASYLTANLERDLFCAGCRYIFVKPFDSKCTAERILSILHPTLMPTDMVKSSFEGRVSDHELEVMVTDIIHQVGVPAHIKGYQYLRDAIMICVTDHNYINAVTKMLYPELRGGIRQRPRGWSAPSVTPSRWRGIAGTSTRSTPSLAIPSTTAAASPPIPSLSQ